MEIQSHSQWNVYASSEFCAALTPRAKTSSANHPRTRTRPDSLQRVLPQRRVPRLSSLDGWRRCAGRKQHAERRVIQARHFRFSGFAPIWVAGTSAKFYKVQEGRGDMIFFWLLFYLATLKWVKTPWHRWLLWASLVIIPTLVFLPDPRGTGISAGIFLFGIVFLTLFQAVRWTYKGIRHLARGRPKTNQAVQSE